MFLFFVLLLYVCDYTYRPLFDNYSEHINFIQVKDTTKVQDIFNFIYLENYGKCLFQFLSVFFFKNMFLIIKSILFCPILLKIPYICSAECIQRECVTSPAFQGWYKTVRAM